VGTLGALSTNGIVTKEVDGFGVFKKTKLEEILKSGFPSGQAVAAGIPAKLQHRASRAW
jgi:hypothetical protein